jgi:origin recognition complex subunit 1
VVSGACGGPRETASPTKAMQLLEAHFATASHFAKRQDETLGGGQGGGGGGGQGGGKRAKRARAVVILIADEIDYLVTRNQGLLYNLFEWSSRADAQLALVGISNTVDLPERLLPRLNSRMGLCRVPFLPYAHAELSQILKARLGELAVFEGSGLELAARKVASVSGDIRRALEICRRATELAEARTAAAADAAAEPPRRPTAKAAGAGADASAPSPARRGGGGAGDGSGTLATPPHAARKPHAATSLVAAPAPSVPSCEARVRIEDIDQAIRSLQTAAPVRVLRRLSCEQQLVLTAAQLEAERTGRQELPARAVLGRYAALCRLHGHAPASEAELRGCLGVLCGWQLLATLPPAAGAAAAMSCSSELDDLLRLGVQAEDLRLALRADGVNAIAKAVL